jgi:hypothetical protein
MHPWMDGRNIYPTEWTGLYFTEIWWAVVCMYIRGGGGGGGALSSFSEKASAWQHRAQGRAGGTMSKV